MGADVYFSTKARACVLAAPAAADQAARLRHLHATLLLLEGVPVHVVANRLGDRDRAVTLRVYAHVLRESAAGVADSFARAASTKGC